MMVLTSEEQINTLLYTTDDVNVIVMAMTSDLHPSSIQCQINPIYDNSDRKTRHRSKSKVFGLRRSTF
jgi:hypothetical protein